MEPNRACTVAADCTPNERCTSDGCVPRTGCPRGCDLACQLVGHQQVVGVADAFGEVDCFVRSGAVCASEGLAEGPPSSTGWVPCFDQGEACLLDGSLELGGAEIVRTEYRCAPMEGSCTAGDTCVGSESNTLVLGCEEGRALGVDCSAVWDDGDSLELGIAWESTCDPAAARCLSSRGGRCGGELFACADEDEDRCQPFSGGIGVCERRSTGVGPYDIFSFRCSAEHVSSRPLQPCENDGSCGAGAACVDAGLAEPVCIQLCNAECPSFCGPEGFCTPLATGPEEWLVSNEGLVIGGCVPVGDPNSALQSFDVCSTAESCPLGHLCSERTGAEGYCRPLCYEDGVCSPEGSFRTTCRAEDPFGMSTSCVLDCAGDAQCPRGLVCVDGGCQSADAARCTAPTCSGVPEPGALATVATLQQGPPTLRGGSLESGNYRLDEVTFHPHGAIASTISVDFSSEGSSGAAVFASSEWQMAASLDLMMAIHVPAAGLTVREPVLMEPVGGGCYTVSGFLIETDPTSCEWIQDEWLPIPEALPYEATDRAIRLLLAIPREAMIGLVEEQRIPGLPASAIVTGDLPVVFTFVPVR
ncbi:MAG: hypothetical protein EA398_16530 [Deltaproteobacteria bacterium]|nr:MAG: hypothetical protein EA398_16530 [Deltaproteobacteria bacterium]